MMSLKEQVAKNKKQNQADYDCDFFAVAQQHCHEGNYKDAITSLTQGIELNPNCAKAYNTRGFCYFKELLHCFSDGFWDEEEKEKNYKLAIDNYSKAIKLNPEYAGAYYNRAICYSKVEEYRHALADFNKAIELNHKYVGAYYKRAMCHVEQKNYELAILDFNRVIELKPEYTEAYTGRADCFKCKGNYNDAIEDYKKAIKLTSNEDPYRDFKYYDIGACYFNRGKYFFNQKKYELAFKDFDTAIQNVKNSDDIEYAMIGAVSNFAVSIGEYGRAREYIKKYSMGDGDDWKSKNADVFLQNIDSAEEIEEKNKALALQIEETKKAYKIAHEKEKEMLSFFTHTMRNALATAPESLRQAIRLLGSEDYESNQKHYEAINEITALFSTLTLTDCLIDTFKQSIYDTEEFKRAWQQDNTGDATPEWFIAAALRQSLNRIIFMEDATGLRKLINNQGELIKPTRKAFIEQVLPLDVNQRDVEKFYHWLQSMTALEVNIEKSTVQFGANQIKFSLMFAISSELILNALKYWSGTGKIQIDWRIEPEHYIFSVSNACKANASSQLAGTHKGLAFIKRLIELLGEQTQFNCSVNEHTFSAELKLHKTLLEG